MFLVASANTHFKCNDLFIRYFATAVESGHSFNGFELNTTATQFVVNLTLTELGLERFEEVLLAVFQYIHMLKTKGVQKQYYDEMKTIEETKFRFKEKVIFLSIENCLGVLFDKSIKNLSVKIK